MGEVCLAQHEIALPFAERAGVTDFGARQPPLRRSGLPTLAHGGNLSSTRRSSGGCRLTGFLSPDDAQGRLQVKDIIQAGDLVVPDERDVAQANLFAIFVA
jgi:hypothetical protein